jgi:serine/threonine-protein kinase
VQSGTGGQIASFALSPNGQLVALRQDQLLSVRPLSSFSAVLLEGTEGGRLPAFSPDGSALAFVAGNRIKRVAASGGPVVDVAKVASVGLGIAWGEDDWLYFSAGLGTGGIWRVPAVGGEAQAVTRVEDALGDNAHTFPQLLPGRKAVLFTALGPSGGSEDARVVAQVRESGERRTLVEHAMFGRFIPTGHLLYATNAGTVFAVPFDPVRIKVTGEAIPVLSDVGTGTWGGGAFFAVSESGTLVFLKRSQRPELVFRVVDSSGKNVSSPFPFDSKSMARVGLAQSPALSPDGQRIALTARGPGSTDIWILDSRSKEAERLTFDPAEDEFPVWSSDGRSVAYTSAQTGTTRRLFVKSVGSGAQPQLLRTWPRHLHFSSWSRDGRWLAADEITSNGTDIWLIPFDGKDPIAVANTNANERGAQFAPDGKWIAYESNESGRPEVYVVSFPGLGARRQVSTGGGIAPQWDPQGRTLYYLQSGSLVAHEVAAGAEFGKGPSRRLFDTQALTFQVASGGRFILSEPNTQPPDAPLHLIVNWFPELIAKFKK